MQGSRLRNAGVKKDDILVSLDDWKVEEIEDVRIFMFDRKRRGHHQDKSVCERNSSQATRL